MKRSPRLRRQLAFLCEIDKLKSVRRRTLLMDCSRRENDAEHAWHLAVMALVFSGAAKTRRLNLLKAIKMLLIHDLVEIDCGDTFLYDEKKRAAGAVKEKKAARRIFGLLPEDQNKEFLRLWQEFEERRSPEARFAAAIDRFQPVLHNYKTRGRVWRRAVIRPEQVLTLNKHIADGAPELWKCVREFVKDGIKKGYFNK
ncbi:MAG: HD domain-containing protein [Chitinispirillaceae bacterium]|nr:HD domain-containing protein [Chitinispirillaceae bacterium]